MNDTEDQLQDDENNQQSQDIYKVLQETQQVKNEKKIRCENFAQGIEENNQPLLCYKQNSPKEELVLEHVFQFKRQFEYHMQHEGQRELFLYPKNECGLYKFICTTIRPTKLGFLELYDFHTCSGYLKDYVQYEDLEVPDMFPDVIPSPNNVARWQKGDCFDMSILLVSLLIGVGYDAYCVYGRAPKEITTKNESLLECLYKNKGKLKEEQDEKKEEEKKVNEFNIRKKQKVISSYDKKIEDRKKDEQLEKQRKAKFIDDDEPDELQDDPFFGKRLHCWVLLKAGKRNVEKNIFIEPSTGRFYYPDGVDCPYESIDAIFNNYNFWINMHQELEVKDINFEEMDTSLNWEYVMLDTLQFQTHSLQDDENGGDEDGQLHNIQKKDQDQDQLQEIAQILDMPPPWPPKIFIDKDNFLKGTPLGEDTIFFNKVKIDNYAPYSQADGLVQKIILYQDYKKLKVQEMRYFYQHRSDKLVIKRKYPFEFKVVEDYDPTPYLEKSSQQWKRLIEIDRQKRTIFFYPNRNHDGLIKREEIIGVKTMEYYENRDDRVVYRSIKFDPNRTTKLSAGKEYQFPDTHMGQNCYVLKMTQKFSKSPNIPANEQIQKMVIDIEKQVVKVYYHMNEGEISPKYRQFDRGDMLGITKLNDTNGGDKNKEDPVYIKELGQFYAMEKECYQQIKHQESQSEADFKSMKGEPIKLEKTIHEKARERFNEGKRRQEDDVTQDTQANDYLYPYLDKHGLLGRQELDYQEALRIKTDVMNKLKERLLSRAEIIQQRLAQEQQEAQALDVQMNKKEYFYHFRWKALNQAIGKFSNNTGLVDTALEEALREKQFKIEILNSRAVRFEASALSKYEEMDRQLHRDPRLKSLLNRNNQ